MLTPVEYPPITPKELESLWYLVGGYGADIHSGPKPNGQDAWQPLKTAFSRASGTAEWPSPLTQDAGMDAKILEQFDGFEKGGAGDVDSEDAHYFAQHFRIPAREECTLRRLLQVAYNSGQLSGSGALTRLGAFDKVWPELYGFYNLGRLHTYCSDGSNFRAPATLVEDIRALVQPR